MALITNGKIYRNLEEQVRKNQEDIENALSLQNLMGINVVGNVPAENMLPDPELYTGEYGDAYAVGLDYPYIYFAFTRPTNVQPKNHWFEIGVFPGIGPKGDTGPAGPQGPTGQSTKWDVNSVNPVDVSNYNKGDLYLNSSTGIIWKLIEDNEGNKSWFNTQKSIKGPKGDTGPIGKWDIGQGNPNNSPHKPGESYPSFLDATTGNVWEYQAGGNIYVQMGNIRGPQGPQGPIGEAGKSYYIAGEPLNSSSQLPDPTLLNDIYKAYLVGTASPYHLWIQVPNESGTLEWIDNGVFQGSDVANRVSTLEGQVSTLETEYTDVNNRLTAIEPIAEISQSRITSITQGTTKSITKRSSDGNILIDSNGILSTTPSSGTTPVSQAVNIQNAIPLHDGKNTKINIGQDNKSFSVATISHPYQVLIENGDSPYIVKNSDNTISFNTSTKVQSTASSAYPQIKICGSSNIINLNFADISTVLSTSSVVGNIFTYKLSPNNALVYNLRNSSLELLTTLDFTDGQIPLIMNVLGTAYGALVDLQYGEMLITYDDETTQTLKVRLL